MVAFGNIQTIIVK